MARIEAEGREHAEHPANPVHGDVLGNVQTLRLPLAAFHGDRDIGKREAPCFVAGDADP